MAEKKVQTAKDIDKKIKELKIELLKNPTKRKSFKKEIAKLLTLKNSKIKLAPKGVPVKGKGE